MVDSFRIGNVRHCGQCKSLGIMLDDELCMEYSYRFNCSKLVKFNLSSTMLQKIYFAIVHSHILYSIELYTIAYPTYLDKLMKLDN